MNQTIQELTPLTTYQVYVTAVMREELSLSVQKQ